MSTFDVIIVGGGPAGYVCAIRAAQLGLATAVVEREKLGGVCVNIGCIPTKALLHSARMAHLVRHQARDLGIMTGSVETDYGIAMKRSRKVADQNAKGVEFLMKKHKVTVLRGRGVVERDRRVRVGVEAYQARKAVVIATGSRVKGLPKIGLELDGKTVISSDDALFLDRAPASLAIVGAGAVGCEFADIFASFGSAVTLIELLPRILPQEDPEASETIAKSFRKRGITVLAGATVTSAAIGSDGAALEVQAGGKTQQVRAAQVLLAAGRAANTEDLGLEACGIQLTPQGFILVDRESLETTAKGYYAIGDVAGPPMLAHKGSREGVYLAERLAGHSPQLIRYDNIPSVTYCHPEVASIGLTEEQCTERGLEFQVGRFPFSANGRARASDETEGFVKILRDRKYGEILGAHIVSGHASELIHELVLAREHEYTVEELDLAVHAHPTLSEAIAEAALDSMGRALHI